MQRSEMRNSIVYMICMAGVIVIILYYVVPLAAARFFPPKDHYTSVHPASTLPPMIGLAPDSVFNVGDVKQLDAFPGIGEVLSQRMIDTREEIDGYRLPEDLMLVKGIGPKTFEKMMDVYEEPLVVLPELSE
ncbi:MAG: helix-hairpin-helix domain-containing protein [Clostridia bacterium]|nr:helix-hairpin-helix domain-containing protein [Clostridia bacterium]